MNITPKEREAIVLIENTADDTGDFNKIDALKEVGLLEKAVHIQRQLHKAKVKKGISQREFNDLLMAMTKMENDEVCSSQDSYEEEQLMSYGTKEQILNMDCIIFGVQMLLDIQSQEV